VEIVKRDHLDREQSGNDYSHAGGEDGKVAGPGDLCIAGAFSRDRKTAAEISTVPVGPPTLLIFLVRSLGG
jgi:hypothetical protein